MKSYIQHQFNKLGFQRKNYLNDSILDKEYHVLKGTIRQKPDKDDAWLFALSANHKHIFDIGSNIGQAAIMMLYNSQIEKIVMVDPNPQALTFAAENLIINSLSHKATFINAFVSEKSKDEIDFYTVGVGAAGSKYKSFAKTAEKSDSHYKVKTLSIDDIVKQTGITPDLLKIDVEGAESEVLAGAKKLAKKGSTTIMVEVHSGEELTIAENTNRVIKWCENNNYDAWYLKTKTLLSTENIQDRGRYHALLLPAGSPFPEYLKSINQGDKIMNPEVLQ